MKFFSGFSLSSERHFFDAYIDGSDYTFCGFSYGAIKAFEATKSALCEGKRVDKLQLFSPAFFQSKDEKFKRLQLMAYRKNEDVYLNQFLNACFSPYEKQELARAVTVIEELEELLYYEWSLKDLQELSRKGVVIEVYLGGEDSIVDAKATKKFFLDVATVTFMPKANHFLMSK